MDNLMTTTSASTSTPSREVDEASIASDFSIIHESLLSEEREALQLESGELRAARDSLTKQLQERAQQLNMCQHHLQALEVKMKRETAEKCEVLGRVGQVVEEKGHLEDNVKTLERALTQERDKGVKNEVRVREVEEEVLTLRKDLEKVTLALRGLEGHYATTKEDLKVTSERLVVEREAREKAAKELEFWTSTVEADLTEKNSLAVKFTTEAGRLRQKDTEQRLEAMSQERDVYRGREEVLTQDHTHLQGRHQPAPGHHRSPGGGTAREAAEKIASDLSGRLQAARAEYHTLAINNRKLLKKLKRLRTKYGVETPTTTTATGSLTTASTMTTSTISTASSWHHAEMEEEEEEEEEGDDANGSCGGGDDLCLTSPPSQQSCCSRSTQQLSDVLPQRQYFYLKEPTQLHRHLPQYHSLPHHHRLPHHSLPHHHRHLPQSQIQKHYHRHLHHTYPTGYHNTTATTPQATTSHPTTTPQAPTTPQPTTPQAPTTVPQAPTTPQQPATDPTPAPRHYYRALPQPTTALPPPLLPETTPAARHAAVLSHFTQQTIPTAPHESDDDDFHSTGESEAPSSAVPHPGYPLPPGAVTGAVMDASAPSLSLQQQESQENGTASEGADAPPKLLSCPMCSLSFPRGTQKLFEEHVSSHLEHVCPVCSKAYQRNFPGTAAKECIGERAEVKAWFCLDGDAGEKSRRSRCRAGWEPGPAQGSVTPD
ncbi:hypothetical protein GWK47_017729 [Chionoecetes opilio]|uniref:UBZ1-type domain-containing protein n=1 Tax=Chionoecetes opilio TaxID=41210 RepID=A0A8J4XRC9_CHIOP|nr:hypothetical protein GWK47_017729 [Chionoecetes opilio]